MKKKATTQKAKSATRQPSSDFTFSPEAGVNSSADATAEVIAPSKRKRGKRTTDFADDTDKAKKIRDIRAICGQNCPLRNWRTTPPKNPHRTPPKLDRQRQVQRTHRPRHRETWAATLWMDMGEFGANPVFTKRTAFQEYGIPADRIQTAAARKSTRKRETHMERSQHPLHAYSTSRRESGPHCSSW